MLGALFRKGSQNGRRLLQAWPEERRGLVYRVFQRGLE
jgi:hypothetical protein